MFALIEMLRLGRWRDWHVWRDLAAATVVVFAITTPFLWPYVQMQQRFNFQRTPQEVITHSATIDAYQVALPRLTVPLALAAFSLLAAIVSLLVRSRRTPSEPAAFDPRLAIALVIFAIGAVWLSLGPVVQWGGRVVDVPAIYPAFARLPGYGGLRVPARFASLFLIFLGMLAGLAVQRIGDRWPRVAPAVALVAASLFLWQGRAQRVPLDQPLPSAGLGPPPAYLTPSPKLPAIYQAVTHLPATAVVAEFPFGDPWVRRPLHVLRGHPSSRRAQWLQRRVSAVVPCASIGARAAVPQLRSRVGVARRVDPRHRAQRRVAGRHRTAHRGMARGKGRGSGRRC